MLNSDATLDVDLNGSRPDLAREVTCGGWATESASCAAFDKLVEASGAFRIYREQPGVYLQPRMAQVAQTPRIDRILSPTPMLIAAGWVSGPVGIECKRSGEKIGPGLAQLLDYSRAVWRLPNGFNVVLDWVFMWPVEKQHCTTASILSQNRIGVVFSTRHSLLRFFAGEALVLDLPRQGEPRIGNGESHGRRSGSR